MRKTPAIFAAILAAALTLCTALAAQTPAYAAPTPPDTTDPRLASNAHAATTIPSVGRKRVGLVLSGGGAKGVAHIGVIKVLEEAGIPIDYIAGTSMGAIVGGLYSIGWTSRELDSLVSNQDWLALLSDKVDRRDKLLAEKEISDTYILSVPFSFERKFSIPSGVLAGQNVLNLLNEMTLGYHDTSLSFDSLPIPFACVAYDMLHGQEVVFREGNLPLAIRASMSIPGAFAPVVRDSMVLVDGGIYNNFPVDVVRSMGADIVIGVDLAAGPHDLEGMTSMMGLIDQITTFYGREKYLENCEGLDLYLKPNIRPYSSSSFSAEAVDTLLNRGERCARENWDAIVALHDRIYPGDGDLYVRKNRIMASDTDSVRIGRIRFIGLTDNEELFVRPSISIEENSTVSKKELTDAIAKLRGSGAFSYVTYTLDSQPPYTLTVSVNEKDQAIVNVGFRFDTEEMASILLNTTISFRGLQGPRLGLTVRLNENPYIRLDFNSSNILLGRLGLSYMFRDNNYRLYQNGRQTNNISFTQHKVDLYLSAANPTSFSPTLGVNYEYFGYKSFLFASETDRIAVKPSGFINYYAAGYLSTLNDNYFPTAGIWLKTELALHTDNGYGYKGSAPFGSAAYGFRWAFSPMKRLTIIPEVWGRTLIGNPVAYSYYNYIGGDTPGRYMDQQIPFVGVNRIESVDRSVLTFHLSLRLRMFKNHYVALLGSYGIDSNSFFNMFLRPSHMGGVALRYSYNSPIGPISLQAGYATITRGPAFSFSLGKTF